ncbi:Ig-like domain-containing protein [Subtercola boreus]|nr:Ig-like domain-containing protein [Subtercola boreus]
MRVRIHQTLATVGVALLGVGVLSSPAAASPPPAFFYGLPSAVWEYGGPALTAVGMNQSFSGDGVYTVFESDEQLTTDATGHQRHVYRRTVADGSLVLVSQRVRTDAPFGSSYNPSISSDGNLIAFETTDTGLFAEDPGCSGCIQIALRDLSAGTTTLVSAPRGSVAPGQEGDSTDAMISADGSRVVFTSSQPGMSNRGAVTRDFAAIESWNRGSGDITGVTGGVDSLGHPTPVNGASYGAVLSADGRFVAFTSVATNLGVPQVVAPAPAPAPTSTPTPTAAPTATATSTPTPSSPPAPATPAPADVQKPRSHVYRWDAQTGTTALVSTAASDAPDKPTQTDEDSYLPSISADGDKVAFISGATNLIGTTEVPKTANHMTDAYVRTLSTGTTHRISVVMVDEPRADLADSKGGKPSMMRSRRWFEPWVSTTRVSLASDGQSAVLTSMNPLVEIHGDCMSCQTFQDNNNALDVFQVRLTADGRPASVQPISLKRDNQTFGNTMDLFLRDSSTGGGDSIADGKTPATSNGSQIAFSSEAGDLRGVKDLTVIQDSGPPYFLPLEKLPNYVDGGVPDEHSNPIRTFTVAANAFNPHLDLPANLRNQLASQLNSEVHYETRGKAQPTLAYAPAPVTATSFLSPSPVVPGASGIVYGLSVTATSAGSAEVVLDLDQLSLESESSIPTYWTRAASDAPNTLTYRTTLMNAGDSAVFSLHLKNTNALATAQVSAVNATVNGVGTASRAETKLAPAKPVCTLPSDPLVVVTGVATALKGAQCTSAKATVAVGAAHGSASINATGIITYTANATFTGTDTVRVTTLDGALRSSESVLIPVTVNAAATPKNDEYSVAKGQSLTVPAPQGVLANDVLTGPAGTWPIQEGNAPLHGKLAMDDSTGAFMFTPDAHYVGDVTFKYLLRGTGWAEGSRSAAATVTIHVLEK